MLRAKMQLERLFQNKNISSSSFRKMRFSYQKISPYEGVLDISLYFGSCYLYMLAEARQLYTLTSFALVSSNLTASTWSKFHYFHDLSKEETTAKRLDFFRFLKTCFVLISISWFPQYSTRSIKVECCGFSCFVLKTQAEQRATTLTSNYATMHSVARAE